MDHIEFEKYAKRAGVDRCYFLRPHVYPLKDNPHRLIENPFEILPDATCIIALIRHYTPIAWCNHHDVPFSAYYLASNEIYHAARDLNCLLKEAGAQAQNAELPAKTVMKLAGIAEIGENTLMSFPGFGTRFAIQFILTNAFEGQTYEREEKVVCTHCGFCQSVCPGGAIGDKTFHVHRCLRWHMDGYMMPNWVKQKLPMLFGCELCQMSCPRNADQMTQAISKEQQALFQYERLIAFSKEDKKQLASLVGKNMISRGRVRAQALCLAKRFWPDEAENWALQYMTRLDCTENEQDVMRWILKQKTED